MYDWFFFCFLFLLNFVLFWLKSLLDLIEKLVPRLQRIVDILIDYFASIWEIGVVERHIDIASNVVELNLILFVLLLIKWFYQFLCFLHSILQDEIVRKSKDVFSLVLNFQSWLQKELGVSFLELHVSYFRFALICKEMSSAGVIRIVFEQRRRGRISCVSKCNDLLNESEITMIEGKVPDQGVIVFLLLENGN